MDIVESETNCGSSSGRPTKTRRITPEQSPSSGNLKRKSSSFGVPTKGLIPQLTSSAFGAGPFPKPAPRKSPAAPRTTAKPAPLKTKHLDPINPGLRMEVLNKVIGAGVGSRTRPSSRRESGEMHPGHLICRLNTKNGELSKRIVRLEEQTVYWRRKSLTLESERDTLKGELSRARTQIEKLDNERLKLQDKLKLAESDGAVCAREISRQVAENSDLGSVVEDLNAELETLMDVSGDNAPSSSNNADPDTSIQEGGSEESDAATKQMLEQALSDTLADLTEKLEEIEMLKSALNSMSRKKSDLEKAVTRHTLLAEMLSLGVDPDNAGEESGLHKDPEGNEEKQKIVRLQDAVEKCMFRIALLTEKNEQYKTVVRHARDRSGVIGGLDTEPGLLSTLQDGQKVQVLESLCMQRYRKLLRETAETMIGQNTRMDESF